MSVNGDLMVVRNGRSTSQVSVYNYPEHLNPFYEDDNHKRLRFWKINKNSKDGEGRRNSFSLGGLKDMWAFKSFRMKKKSSSLGINKTSESPPPLRRDIYNNDKGYGTYDPRMRYTTQATNGIGSNDPFQRNVPYRSSLQDMRTSQPEQPINGIGFNRNDRYRSTLQAVTTSGTPTQSLTLPPMRRYVYQGSVTPQPKRNLEFNSDSLGMISHGSSQVSVASTNPFDDEDDDDVDMSGISAASTPAKHPTRKKRRAPPPPIPVHQIIKEESSSAGSTPSHKPSTSPPKASEVQDEQSLEIHNLTAEIENFVNSSNLDDSHEVRSSTPIVTSNSPKRNGTVPISPILPTRETNNNDEESSFIRDDRANGNVDKNSVNEIGQVNLIHVTVDSPRSTMERTQPSELSTFRSEAKPPLPKKVGKPSSNEVIHITEVTKNVKESHGNIKPPIAAKPNIPKSPPPVSSRSSSIPREVSLAETPDTPAMRRKKIQLVKEASLSPELTHREIRIESPHHTPTLTRQDVTIQVQRIVVVPENENEQISPESTPVLTIREQKPTPTERNSSLYAIKNSNVKDKILNISPDPMPLPRAEVEVKVKESTSNLEEDLPTTNVSDKILNISPDPRPLPRAEVKVEESISSLEEDLPTTISELQLKISEGDQFQKQPEKSVNEIPHEAPVPVHPAPIVKPQRTKHLVEENGENIYRPRPSQWKQSTLAPLEPVPPEKRRSVNQIIDSINRSQRLLGGARKEDETKIEVNNSQRNESEANTNTMEQNLKSLAESQREMKRMLLELEGLENAHEKKLSNKTDENFQGILDTIVSTLARDTDKNSNGDVFKKCTITKEVSNASRESSPTSSNIDWNPVPKPKRTNKNLSPELQLKKKNNEY